MAVLRGKEFFPLLAPGSRYGQAHGHGFCGGGRLVQQRGIPAKRIIVYGASLGSAVATSLAADREVGGVEGVAPRGFALALRFV